MKLGLATSSYRGMGREFLIFRVQREIAAALLVLSWVDRGYA